MRNIPIIPYFQTSRYRVQAMVDLAKPTPDDLVADLGMGDGRISFAFAKTGAQVHGYEIDEELIKALEVNIKSGSISGIKIYKRDFWFEDLSKYTIVCCYPMPTIMGRLEKKLKDELKPGARIVLNYFPFLHWKEKKIKDNVYLYIR
jgi:16S rRNA A1518/A1519 N6-dimethyltransferase RsmA/KsgA/DIM1 with predicted DNA glycosylase/AP lyase activity